MFKVVQNARAWWPVTWNGVTEEGSVVENKIELRFIVHGEDEFLELFEEGRRIDEAKAAEVDGEKPKLSELYAAFLEKVAVDWRGVHAENGDPLKWEAENVRLAMNVPGLFKACLASMVGCRLGQKDLRQGN
jgi:hypothetical protein